MLRALRPPDADHCRSIDNARLEVLADVGGGDRCDRDGPVLVPVVRFVEQPEGVILDRTNCWIWTKPDDLGDDAAAHVL